MDVTCYRKLLLFISIDDLSQIACPKDAKPLVMWNVARKRKIEKENFPMSAFVLKNVGKQYRPFQEQVIFLQSLNRFGILISRNDGAETKE